MPAASNPQATARVPSTAWRAMPARTSSIVAPVETSCDAACASAAAARACSPGACHVADERHGVRTPRDLDGKRRINSLVLAALGIHQRAAVPGRGTTAQIGESSESELMLACGEDAEEGLAP